MWRTDLVGFSSTPAKRTVRRRRGLNSHLTCSAGQAESVLQGRIVIAVHRAFVSGCEGSSIAELCSVVSRVARET